MAKVQDTYNPVTGEYVKRISDWKTLDKVTNFGFTNSKFNATRCSLYVESGFPNGFMNENVYVLKNDTSQLKYGQTYGYGDMVSVDTVSKIMYLSTFNKDTGFSGLGKETHAEWGAYFKGWKMANADGTSPYYKSEVPYTPATWVEWTKWNAVGDASGITLTSNGTDAYMDMSGLTNLKPNTKYGTLANVLSNTLTTRSVNIQLGNGVAYAFVGIGELGHKKTTYTTPATLTNTSIHVYLGAVASGQLVKLKDFRIFELPTGSQIEADFTNLSADELSAKYTFNGLCVKNWKKVTDGTGLTSTLPTASYAGYTPYKMIYQLATPEISYLTPKTTIPLYDTNTILETNTLADCKADVTVGYKLKSGANAIAGDIAAPTPDYMSTVNSVSEDGLGKGIVRGKNLSPVNNVTFTLTTDSGKAIGNTLQSVIVKNIKIDKEKGYRFSAKKSIPSGMALIFYTGLASATVHNGLYSEKVSTGNGVEIGAGGTATDASGYYMNTKYDYVAITTSNLQNNLLANTEYQFGYLNIQIEEGNSATTFEGYKMPVEAILPTLRKIGTVADTYNPETGVLVQRIGKKVFDGTETGWTSAGTRTNTILFAFPSTIGAIGTGGDSINITSTHFLGDWVYSNDREGAYLNPSGLLRFSLSKEKFSSIERLQVYLAQQYANGTPVTVYYQLATPVVTTITKTALPTYKPTTVIESDSPVKGNVNADYKLKANATPVAGDFIANPECMNDIKDLGNSIDVVSSVGRKNLLISSTLNRLSDSMTEKTTQRLKGYGDYYFDFTFPLKPNTRYTVSNKAIYNDSPNYPNKIRMLIYNVNTTISKFTVGDMSSGDSISFTTPLNTLPDDKFLFYPASTIKSNFDIFELKLEEGENRSIYTPAPEDISYNTITNGVYKTNILLSAPLRSVGDVKDRLFKDSDGKWKVERNIGKTILNGTEIWQDGSIKGENLKFGVNTTPFVKIGSPIVSDSFKAVVQGSVSGEIIQEQLTIYKHETVDEIRVNIHPSRLSTGVNVSGFKSWLGSHNISIEYQLATPTYETLSQELQTKLDNIPTFPEHNYVYTVTNDNLQPTLHVDYKKLSWLKSRLLLNSLKIYSRNLTDAEMIQNYKVEKERFGM